MLRGPRKGLPDWGEVFQVCHLHQVKQVKEVHTKVICRDLILFLIPKPACSQAASPSAPQPPLRPFRQYGFLLRN